MATGLAVPAVIAGPGLAARQAASALPALNCAVPPPAGWRAGLEALGRTRLRCPGTLPQPARPAGADGLAGIDHIVVLMMENHTDDNVLGRLGRGDGLPLGPDGQPRSTNPYPDGAVQHAFHMPTTCQLPEVPSQEWAASHTAYDGGRNDGFVRTTVSPADSRTVGGVAMGYWTGADLPFTYSLASHFAVGDRWFSSSLAQTDTQRRFLVAGTSSGMTDTIGTGAGDAVADADLGLPATTVFNQLDGHGISWADYAYSYPTGATPNLYPTTDGVTDLVHNRGFAQFFADAAAGRLPAVSMIDENMDTDSQENPQNVVDGEEMMARVVDSVGASPDWPSTLLVITYDEGGGYYDHVPPPAAVPPDDIPALVSPGESAYDGFARYGFRVPAIVVSPYARPGYVSSVVHDHTSILATIERRWNLPALTWRDANANDMTDFLDTAALARRRPDFPALPRLAAPAPDRGCRSVTIPPPGSVTPAGAGARNR